MAIFKFLALLIGWVVTGLLVWMLAPQLVALGLFLPLAFIAPQVGYRWWDALLALIPFVGLYLAGKWLWRYAHLPTQNQLVAETLAMRGQLQQVSSLASGRPSR